MASRHDIISITFQANAGKANVALKALQSEAQRSSDRVKELKKQLEDGLRANLPSDQIQKIQASIKAAEKEVKQWNAAYKELTKGVRTLDEAIKEFNAGTMGQMSAAFNKAAANAAKLAQTKMTPGTQEWKEMDALIVEAQSNVLKANTAINELTANIKKGGAASKSTLTQAKSDLEQLLTLEVRGSAEWNTYNKQLKIVEGELNKLAQAEQRALQADQTAAMTKRMKNLKTESSAGLAEMRRYWETMAAGAEKGSAELAKYEANLKKVVNQEKQRATASAEQVIGSPNKYGVEQMRNAVQEMTRLRDSVQQGIPAWLHYNKLVKEGEAYLQEYAEREKIARGEAVSLADALKISANAGGKGFTGTAQQLQQAEAALQKALSTAKKGSPEWLKYQEALAKVRVEMQNTRMTSERMREILDKPANAKNLNELQAAVKRAKAELDLMAGTVGTNNKQYAELAKRTKEAEIQMKQLQAQSHGTSSAFEKAWSRLKTYIGLYVGAAVAMQKIAGTLGDLMELSDKMGEVRKTTGFTADEVGRLTENLKRLDVRSSITDLLDLSAAAGQMGLKTQESIEGFTKAANMLTIALPEMGRQSAVTLMKIANATGDLEKNGGDVEETLQRVGSTIIALRANSASAAPAITDFVSRIGAVGAQAGISIDQIAALGSTIDALGGRVEMSATALSRMIPAIRNNAFGVANAIGVTEKTLTDLFNQGRAMEAMVLIFRKMRESVQQFDTSTEEGMNAMANNVEDLLGKNASMAEVMKELNQQGARAGIVFGLLSQNVDELEKQLGTASDAYRDNTALLKEFGNMNETTAAKWARLKNQLEEFFVGDRSQRWLGTIIDGLRKIVDFITEDGPIGSFFRYTILYLTLMKAKWAEAFGGALISMGKWLLSMTASTAATTADTAAKTANAAATTAVGNASAEAAVKTNIFTTAWGKMNAAMKANVVAAVATAVIWLGTTLWESAKKSKEAARQLNDVEDAEKKAREESVKMRAELYRQYEATQDQTKSIEERKKALRDMVGDEKYKQYYENLSTESELATAAASAYKELSEQILATARARALDAKAEELQRKRIELEDQKMEREDFRDKNKEEYNKNKAAYEKQSSYVEEATRSAAGFPEAGIAQRGSAAMKPAIIDKMENNEREISRIESEIEQVDADIDRLKKQVDKIKPDNASDSSGGGGSGGGGSTNPYGNYDRVTSDYGKWDADSLVKRRKEMLERVRALANGADVQAVLSEDAKFISEATRKNIKTTRDAIEWYNTERLKIQEALHERHLTNTGDWLDPKKQKARKKLFETDLRAYLEELDAYYTERKTRIQEAGNEEGITEAEVRNRTLANEVEWRQRRAELQKLYADKSKEVTEDEQQAIYDIIAERTGDEASFIEKTLKKTVDFSHKVRDMNEHGAKEYRKWMADLGLGWERDLNRQARAVAQQMKAIQDIIDKERPFNGITKNLRENLVTMGILTADMTRERDRLMREGLDMADFNARQAAEELKRTTFMLGEAENAYTTTIEDVMRHMADAGLTAWADELRRNPKMQEGMIAQLHSTYDAIQEAIKKEASLWKKEAEIMWNNILMPDGKNTLKQTADRVMAQLGLDTGRVQRANSLIGAGQASERVADRLAIKQMQIQLTMQEHYYNLMRKRGQAMVDDLNRQAEAARQRGDIEEATRKTLDAQHAQMALNLATSKEETELAKQRENIIARTEESQNRLYNELKSWSDLIASSLQSVFEASHAGDAEYYNELAKLNLTGKGGPGAGTYVVIDNAGTSGATAHYEHLSEREALERHHEIERQNAQAEAWKKVMDDINMKMSETITDQMNAMLQNASVDANTDAEKANTQALIANTEAILNGRNADASKMDTSFASSLSPDMGAGAGKTGQGKTPSVGFDGLYGEGSPGYMPEEYSPQMWDWSAGDTNSGADWRDEYLQRQEAHTEMTQQLLEQQQKIVTSQNKADKTMTASAQSAFAKMSQAANLYGIAYQAMSNDNMSATQKFGMIAIQAAGNAAITALTANMSQATGDAAINSASVWGKLWNQLGWWAIPVYALFTGTLGGLMGLAASKIAKSKSEIASVTGASNSVASGRLTTGMLTYAEGNVNEFTDPATLTPGRQYNVDGDNGKTYRARYMGKGAKTHITHGPEFHLVGEEGSEAIIDAHTTRNIQMNEPEVWRVIQTLYNGGSLRHTRRRGRGVSAFADGNIDDFDEMGATGDIGGLNTADMEAMRLSLDRNSAVQEALLERLSQPIQAKFDVYGKGGLVDSYDTGKKTVNRYGQRF